MSSNPNGDQQVLLFSFCNNLNGLYGNSCISKIYPLLVTLSVKKYVTMIKVSLHNVIRDYTLWVSFTVIINMYKTILLIFNIPYLSCVSNIQYLYLEINFFGVTLCQICFPGHILYWCAITDVFLLL